MLVAHTPTPTRRAFGRPRVKVHELSRPGRIAALNLWRGAVRPLLSPNPPPLGLPSAADDADARWLRVFNSCPVALSLTRWDNHTFVEVNSAFLTLLEWTRDEVIGQTPVSLGILDPDSAGRLRERLRTAAPVRTSKAQPAHGPAPR